MRRVCLLLLLCLAARSAQGSTLDPSHPLWSTPGVDSEAWRTALAELATQRALPLKWHQEGAARGRIAAVGKRVLVIPVLPADAPAAPRTQAELEDLWGGPGEGTVRGFWEFTSSGELLLEVRVLPWLAVPGTLQTDYPNVINGVPGNLSAGPRALARDALEAAARLVDDFHAFDDDGPDGIPGSGDDDGIVDLVVILHPFEGWETNPVATPRAIVSVQSRLKDPVVDGLDLRADAFVVASAQGPLGVWVHEFGHLLGLPDLYDLDRNPVDGTVGGLGPQGGLGRWSLMASGTWGGDGTLPAGLDAWSRQTLGFGSLEEFESQTTRVLPWIDREEARMFRLRPLGDWGEEAFLLEARRPRVGGVVDGDLPGSGALVYHVRPDLPENRIASKFLELLQADGREDLDQGVNDGDAGDPYPGAAMADRLDSGTQPSSESAHPSPARTPPALRFTETAAGISVDFALSSGAALRLNRFGIEDAFLGTRAWLRPRETGPLTLGLAGAGAVPATSATVEILVRPEGRLVQVVGPNPALLRLEGGEWVLDEAVSLRDAEGSDETGVALLDLVITPDLGDARTVPLGLPVRFREGLLPDALVRFRQTIHQAGSDTTRFRQLDFGTLPRPAFVGYELETGGMPDYADSMEVSLDGDWFAIGPERRVWVWTRGVTETVLPGQAFDGAAIEVLYPDRGWQALTPEGPSPTWIARKSGAATRDRLGFGGIQPTWTSWSMELPKADLPARLRVRFASDASISDGWWEVAGLQTDALPRASITLDTQRNTNAVTAVARLSGDFSRVNLAQYRYRTPTDSVWRPASGNFSIVSSTVFSVALTQLPAEISRATIALFSGTGEAAYLLGSAGLFRPGPTQMPTLTQNPARGEVVLQLQDLPTPLAMSVYDPRGRRRARFTIPARTTWFQWEPRSENGAILSSGKYYLRADEMDLGVAPFTWFR